MGGDIPPLGPKAWDGLTKMMAENQAEAFGTSFEEEYEKLVKAGVARKRKVSRLRTLLTRWRRCGTVNTKV